jgi:hypothetical protein
MTSVALDTPRELPRFRAVAAAPFDHPEPWELNSELVLVSPEVRTRALELLPERDPDAYLAQLREPGSAPTGSTNVRELAAETQPLTTFGYARRRAVQTAGCGLVAAGGLVALASLAELFH